MSLELIQGYIKGKLTQRGKPSFGVAFLKDYGDVDSILPQASVIAYDVIGHAFTRDKTDDPIGTAKLTQVSTKIGVEIARLMYDDELQWNDHVRIGDLFVEAFYQNEYINIERRMLGKKKVKNKNKEDVEITDSITILTVTDKWVSDFGTMPEELSKYRLRGTVFVKPQDIRGVMQRVERDGEIIGRYPIVKGWGFDQHEKCASLKDMPAMKAINHLQQTPWTINSVVFEALKKQSDKIVSDKVFEDRHEEERRRSKKIELDFTLSKAEMLLGRKFYSLMDFDYRGRVYNRETMFNFQGSDTARGLFLFHEKKPVDERGFDWMCIHAASSFNQSYKIDDIPDWCRGDYKSYLESEGLEDISVDKMMLIDRIEWTMQHLTEIQLTAELNNIHMYAEKPVSYLAVCHEINNYINSEGVYYSGLPIPIDGSNNGWQHLGAISKDYQTGKLVGLVPVPIQQDFYVQTAKRLISITKDESRSSILSNMPMKKIRKGISKRGSMTRAYSAGAQKIAENMVNDLRKEGLDREYCIDNKMCMGFSRDLIKAIEMTCTGPLKTMKYFQKLAAAIVETDDNIRWVTPSGFFVEYYNYHTKSILQKGTIAGYGKRGLITHRALVETDSVDKRGFACGISPNYIHSLDASHMALVIANWGGAFGAIHDSYSTHACDVDDLLALTKHIFVQMYNEDNYYEVIERSILNTYDGFIDRPELGTLDINDVKKSDYFFA
jgi:DNA-directed RNA polymerase